MTRQETVEEKESKKFIFMIMIMLIVNGYDSKWDSGYS